MDIVGALGVLGFGLALALAVLEYHRYHISLKMRVREIRLVGSSRDMFLVLLRVTFVNPATKGRTVFHLRVGAPDREAASQPPYEYDEDYDTLVYELPTSRNVRVHLSLAETLQLPLDIPPHQSRSHWFPVAIQRESVGTDIPSICMHLLAEDVDEKTIAQFHQSIELRTHTIA
jgi:hypothetical protein